MNATASHLHHPCTLGRSPADIDIKALRQLEPAVLDELLADAEAQALSFASPTARDTMSSARSWDSGARRRVRAGLAAAALGLAAVVLLAGFLDSRNLTTPPPQRAPQVRFDVWGNTPFGAAPPAKPHENEGMHR